MNMNVFALMLTIGGVFIGAVFYALVHGEPILLLALAAVACLAFAPWHQWLK
jgi:hypothetical protein